MIHKLKESHRERKILLFFFLSLFIYILFVLYADIKKITDVALSFKWQLVPLLLILTLLNYFFRALRFNFYLRELNIHIPFFQSVLIFLSGLSMTATPGKSGEIIKAYLVKKTTHHKVSEIIPLLIIERLTDGVSMILMGIGGVFLFKNSQLFFMLSGLFVLLFIIVIKMQKYIIQFIIALEKKYPRLKVLDFFILFFRNSQKLINFKSFLVGVGLGLIAWSFEGFSLYLLMREFSDVTFLQGVSTAFFVFSFASIAGFFVLIPGGVGIAEGSITYFLTTLTSLSITSAIFATLLFRFVTLWFGVLLGLICLMNYLNKTTNSERRTSS